MNTDPIIQDVVEEMNLPEDLVREVCRYEFKYTAYKFRESADNRKGKDIRLQYLGTFMPKKVNGRK